MDTDLAKAAWYLTDASEHCQLTESQSNPVTEALISFLPKSQLVEWKYDVLRCILLQQPTIALALLKSGSANMDTAS
jgi:hypothetical protein